MHSQEGRTWAADECLVPAGRADIGAGISFEERTYPAHQREMALLGRQLLLVQLLVQLLGCLAPTGTSFSRFAAPPLVAQSRAIDGDGTAAAASGAQDRASSASSIFFACASAAALARGLRCPSRKRRAPSQSGEERAAAPAAAATLPPRPTRASMDILAAPLPVDIETSDEDFSASVDEDDESASDEGRSHRVPCGRKAGSKLWSRRQFPEGTEGHKNWDVANLQAAQAWTCPCADRVNCIGKDRLQNVLDLYDHRKKFRTTAHTRGGLRDACRDELQRQYDPSSRKFRRAFKVCCALMPLCAACQR